MGHGTEVGLLLEATRRRSRGWSGGWTGPPGGRSQSGAVLGIALGACLLSFSLPARAQDVPAAGGEAAGDAPDAGIASEADPRSPFRGTEFDFRNVASVVGLDPGSELTWNPYYAMEFGFQFRWWFDDWFAGARLDVTREITQADETTFAGEAWVSDLLLVGGGRPIYTIPVAEIALSADVVLTVPTSKVSQARTLVLGIGPGVRLSRSFEGGGTWNLAYRVRVTPYLHRTTTAELETPLIPSCTSSGNGCDAFVNTGLRNARVRVQHGVDLSYEPLDWLSFGTGFEHILDWLYPIEGDDPRISLTLEDPTDERHASWFYVEATFTPIPALEVGIGYETLAPRLAPDSSYYNPFYNRYSTVYLDLRLSFDGLVSMVSGDEEGGT
jgi:hypothetical protein